MAWCSLAPSASVSLPGFIGIVPSVRLSAASIGIGVALLLVLGIALRCLRGFLCTAQFPRSCFGEHPLCCGVLAECHRCSRWRMRANPRFAPYAPGEGAAVIGRKRRSLGSLRGIRIEYAGSIAEFWGRMGKTLLTYRQSSHLRFWFHITRTGKRMACPLHEMLPLLRRKIIDAVRNSKDRFALRVPPHF